MPMNIRQKTERHRMLEVPRKYSTVETITPEMAQRWLRGNTKNRHHSSSVVREYARAMLENRWRVNGESIKLTADDRLLDGQHRLLACIEADCEFKSYVVRGIDGDTFDTIDTGKKRTAGDILGIDGCRNFNAVAAAVRWVTLIRSGLFRMSSCKMSADEVRLFWAAEMEIEESTARAMAAKRMLAPGLAGGLHYLFSKKDPEQADRFFQDIGNGVDLKGGDAVFVLRERVIKDRMSKSKLLQEEVAALCIRAWNHRRERNDVPTTMLRGSYVQSDGKRAFPEIV